MGTFTIYAIVVTGLYIAYMAVVLAMDTVGHKGQKKGGAEEFDTTGMVDGGAEETSTIVDETDGGFEVSSGSTARQQHPDSELSNPVDDEEEVVQEEQPVDDFDDETALQQESKHSQTAYEQAVAVQTQAMVSVKPGYQDEYLSEEFSVATAQPMERELKIVRKITNI